MMHRRSAFWVLTLLVAATGCESKLDNPADPLAGAYVGFRPWVDSGRTLRSTIDDTLTFQGVFHGPLDRVEAYEWDFDGDGRLDYVSGDTRSARWAYGEAGVYRAVFTVTDRAGFSRWDTTEVIVTNELPVALGGPDREGFLNTTVGFPARAADDGRIVAYRWDYGMNGGVDWQSAEPGTAYALYAEAGTYEAVLEVVDDDGNTGRDEVVVSISLGCPVAYAGRDTAISIGDWAFFRGEGVDANGMIIRYDWDFDGDGAIDWSDPSTGHRAIRFDTRGERLAVLTVTDNDSLTDIDTVSVTVTDLPPVVRIRSPGLGWCARAETLSAMVVDDGAIVSYEWDFEGDGLFDRISDVSSWVVYQYWPGEYSPVLRVIDDDGNETVETITFQVGPWTSAAPMNYPRTGVGVEAVDGVLYAVAGYSREIGAYTSVVEAYDPNRGRWEIRRPMALSQLGMATAVVEDRIYGMAGCSGGEVRGAVEEYWPERNRWRRRASVQQKRCWAAAGTVDGLIYVFGGVSENGEELRSVEVFDPEYWAWRDVSAMPAARHEMAATVFGRKIYLIGGVANGVALSTVEVYDPASDRWSSRSPMPTARGGLAAVTYNNRIYAIGGSYLDVVEVYNPATDTWTTVTPMPTARHGPGAAVIGSNIYVAGGESSSGSLATLEVYAPTCDEVAR